MGKRFQIINNKILPNVKVDIYINQKNGIIVVHNENQYKALCGNDVPNTYSTNTINTLYKENREKVVEWALEYLTFDSKLNEPILISF